MAGLALLLFIVAALLAPRSEAAEASIYFFWGAGCPHCAEAEPFLRDLARRHPGAQLHSFEVWYDDGNARLFARMAEAHGFAAEAVPTIVIGDRYWIGYGESLAPQIEAALGSCLADGCPDAGAGVIPGKGTAAADGAAEPAAGTRVVELPFIGAIDLAGHALWTSTLLIAVVDGFNPCSLWVLSILVALALHTGSRGKILLIGLTFITVTAAVYALFIAGLFTVLNVVGLVGWIRGGVALVALFFGAINVKDYFFYREGLSFTIDDRRKPGLYRGIRRILEAGGSPWSLVGATVVLAAGVSLVEFSCTAGFPVIWTNLLAAEQVSPLAFALLLLLYLAIYQADELAIFLAAVFTLKAGRVDERQGRILKLVGGILMLTLAGVMLVDPALMNRIGSSLAVFAVAFAVTAVVLLLHRRILPAFGIRIGSEKPPGGSAA